MKISAKSIILLALMLLSAALGAALRPHISMADERPPIDLAAMVPTTFADWHELQSSSGQIVNPQQQEKLNSLYSQLLTRTYVNTLGQRIMLSIAYGRDQRSYMAVHYPEACYPAQGFRLITNKVASFSNSTESFSVRQLETALGEQRFEPVTYWTTIGDYGSLGGFAKRLVELQYGMEGKIPDGLIFRVSSIGKDSAIQFALQQVFISTLLKSISPDQRALLTGKKDI